jgi:hypothetical protein
MPDDLEHPLRPHDYEANAYKLLGVLLSHASDRDEQAVTSAWYNRAQEQGAHGRQLELACASALIDGLRHGNWPWKINSTT